MYIFFFIHYLPEDGLKRLKHVGLPHVCILLHIIIVKNVKCTLLQELRFCTGRTAHRASGGIALQFHDHGVIRVVRGQRHAPAALYSRERPCTHYTGGWVGI